MRRAHAQLGRTVSTWVAAGVLIVTLPASLRAQLRSPNERIEELEKKLEEMEEELEELKEKAEAIKDEEDIFAGGLELLGGTKLRLGGKAEILLIDNQFDRFAPLGAEGVTENPDPYLDLQRFRLYPIIELNRWFTVEGQLDFRPDGADTRVKELYLRHDARAYWWLDTRAQLGLDDRFIRPNRRTETYPLIGNAFWRDESMAFIGRLTFGDEDGRPVETPEGEEIPPAPFDFARNWGELHLYFSIGQGYQLDENELQFDGAAFNQLVQDDRELEDDLSLREIGVGLEYRRDFQAFGELAAIGFVYDSELSDGSLRFLQQDLTLRAPGGAPIAGYGNSNDRQSYLYGGGVEYFFPASTIFGDWFDTRGNDGFRVLAQYIRGVDGDLERQGWFVQSSYRFSFDRLLVDRYFRSLEPIVRYGTLDVNLAPVPELPGTWDRQELLIGAILEVTGDIWVDVEYVFNREDTGTRQVDNDVFLVDLILNF